MTLTDDPLTAASVCVHDTHHHHHHDQALHGAEMATAPFQPMESPIAVASPGVAAVAIPVGVAVDDNNLALRQRQWHQRGGIILVRPMSPRQRIIAGVCFLIVVVIFVVTFVVVTNKNRNAAPTVAPANKAPVSHWPSLQAQDPSTYP